MESYLILSFLKRMSELLQRNMVIIIILITL